MVRIISSVSNPTIKRIKALYDKSSLRKSSGEFIVEGVREILRAYQAKYVLRQLIFNPYITSIESLVSIFGIEILEYDIIEVNDPIYRKLAYRENQEGLIAVFKEKSHGIADLKMQTDSALYLVVESSEKPGNIGAMLRTAEAAGVDAVLLADIKTDLYNPNIIRSSVGAAFSTQICMASTEEIIAFLIQKNIKTYCAYLGDESQSYLTQNYQGNVAIIVGAEDEGLSIQWQHPNFQNIIIPMYGKIDSLNVSVSAGILIFEALRQRKATLS